MVKSQPRRTDGRPSAASRVESVMWNGGPSTVPSSGVASVLPTALSSNSVSSTHPTSSANRFRTQLSADVASSGAVTSLLPTAPRRHYWSSGRTPLRRRARRSIVTFGSLRNLHQSSIATNALRRSPRIASQSPRRAAQSSVSPTGFRRSPRLAERVPPDYSAIVRSILERNTWLATTPSPIIQGRVDERRASPRSETRRSSRSGEQQHNKPTRASTGVSLQTSSHITSQPSQTLTGSARRVQRGLFRDRVGSVDANTLAQSKDGSLQPTKHTIVRSSFSAADYAPVARQEITVNAFIEELSDPTAERSNAPSTAIAAGHRSCDEPTSELPSLPAQGDVEDEKGVSATGADSSVGFDKIKDAFIAICTKFHLPNTYQSRQARYTPTVLLSFHVGSTLPVADPTQTSCIVLWRLVTAAASASTTDGDGEVEGLRVRGDVDAAVSSYITYEPPRWSFGATATSSRVLEDGANQGMTLSSNSDGDGDPNQFFQEHAILVRRARERLSPAPHTLYLFDVLFDLARISQTWRPLLDMVPRLADQLTQSFVAASVDEWLDDLIKPPVRVKRQYGRRGELGWRDGKWATLQVMLFGDLAKTPRHDRALTPLSATNIFLYCQADVKHQAMPFPHLLYIPSLDALPPLTTPDEERALSSYLHRAETVSSSRQPGVGQELDPAVRPLFPSTTADDLIGSSGCSLGWSSHWFLQDSITAAEGVVAMRAPVDSIRVPDDNVGSTPGRRGPLKFVSSSFGAFRLLDTQLGSDHRADSLVHGPLLYAGYITPPPPPVGEKPGEQLALMVDDYNRWWLYEIQLTQAEKLVKKYAAQVANTLSANECARRECEAKAHWAVVQRRVLSWVVGRHHDVCTAMTRLPKHPATGWYAHPGSWPVELLDRMLIMENNPTLMKYDCIGPAPRSVAALLSIGNQGWCVVGTAMEGRCGLSACLGAKQDGSSVSSKKGAAEALRQSDSERAALKLWYEALPAAEQREIQQIIFNQGEYDYSGHSSPANNTFETALPTIVEQVKNLLTKRNSSIGMDIIGIWSKRERINVLVVHRLELCNADGFTPEDEGSEQLVQALPRLVVNLQRGRPFIVLLHAARYTNNVAMPSTRTATSSTTALSTSVTHASSGHYEVLAVHAASAERAMRRYRSLFRQDDPVYAHLLYLSECSAVTAAPTHIPQMQHDQAFTVYQFLHGGGVPGFDGSALLMAAQQCVAQDEEGNARFHEWVTSHPGVWRDGDSHLHNSHNRIPITSSLRTNKDSVLVADALLHAAPLAPAPTAPTASSSGECRNVVTESVPSSSLVGASPSPSSIMAQQGHASPKSLSRPAASKATTAADASESSHSATTNPTSATVVESAARPRHGSRVGVHAGTIDTVNASAAGGGRHQADDALSGRRHTRSAEQARLVEQRGSSTPAAQSESLAITTAATPSNKPAIVHPSIISQYSAVHSADVNRWWNDHARISEDTGLWVGHAVDIFTTWEALRQAHKKNKTEPNSLPDGEASGKVWLNNRTHGKSKKSPPPGPGKLQMTCAYLASVGQDSLVVREQYNVIKRQFRELHDAGNKAKGKGEGGTKRTKVRRALSDLELPWVTYPLSWVDEEGVLRPPVYSSAAATSSVSTGNRARQARSSVTIPKSSTASTSSKKRRHEEIDEAEAEEDAGSTRRNRAPTRSSLSTISDLPSGKAGTGRSTRNSQKPGGDVPVIRPTSSAAAQPRGGTAIKTRRAKPSLEAPPPTSKQDVNKSRTGKGTKRPRVVAPAEDDSEDNPDTTGQNFDESDLNSSLFQPSEDPPSELPSQLEQRSDLDPMSGSGASSTRGRHPLHSNRKKKSREQPSQAGEALIDPAVQALLDRQQAMFDKQQAALDKQAEDYRSLAEVVQRLMQQGPSGAPRSVSGTMTPDPPAGTRGSTPTAHDQQTQLQLYRDTPPVSTTWPVPLMPASRGYETLLRQMQQESDRKRQRENDQRQQENERFVEDRWRESKLREIDSVSSLPQFGMPVHPSSLFGVNYPPGATMHSAPGTREWTMGTAITGNVEVRGRRHQRGSAVDDSRL